MIVYIMAYIPNLLFSQLLFKYPKLWGLNSEWVDWDVAARHLAASLTDKLGYLVTTKDVRCKVKAIKCELRQLDKSKGTARTRLCAFLWYALRLGLRHAADRLTKQLISDGKLKIEIERVSEDFLGFDEKEQIDQRFLPYLQELIDELIDRTTMRLKEEMIDEQIGEIVRETFGGTTEEQTISGIQSPANRIIDNHNIIEDVIDVEHSKFSGDACATETFNYNGIYTLIDEYIANLNSQQLLTIAKEYERAGGLEHIQRYHMPYAAFPYNSLSIKAIGALGRHKYFRVSRIRVFICLFLNLI
uniref:Uncharacterized protein n=1 Tax=Glossina pallidipes TaxID=7398 RepID=A0A1A9Z0D6_GLOPL